MWIHWLAGRGDNVTHSLFYSIRPDAGVTEPLAGPRLADSPPTVPVGDERLLGQLDWVEAGVIFGWACLRSTPRRQIKVPLRQRTRVRVREGRLKIENNEFRGSIIGLDTTLCILVYVR